MANELAEQMLPSITTVQVRATTTRLPCSHLALSDRRQATHPRSPRPTRLPLFHRTQLKADMLQGSNLIAWRSDLDLSRAEPTGLPPTLVVLNPGDQELAQPPRASAAAAAGAPAQRAGPGRARVGDSAPASAPAIEMQDVQPRQAPSAPPPPERPRPPDPMLPPTTGA